MPDKADYRGTLNLPRTGFPMKADLVKREPEFLAAWERMKLYEAMRAARSSNVVQSSGNTLSPQRSNGTGCQLWALNRDGVE